MSIPWNDWYHVTANTYGTWLRGDPRGWRERHHRKHVDGDYKNRPKPGTGKEELELSKELMKRDEVRLGKQLQLIVLMSIVATLLNDGIEILVVSLDDHHLHVLARFRDRQPRKRMGWAKLQATKAVKRFMEIEQTHGRAVGFQLELKVGEGLWAKRGKENPINDRQHQLNSVEYIADHSKRGAVVYLHANADRWLRERKKQKSKESPRRRRGSGG
jgi:hypothetical protein